MKRVLPYVIPDDGKPHAVPRGTPVAFGGVADDGGLFAWWEVYLPRVDFDPEVYEPETQWVQITETFAPSPDSWRWLASYASDGAAWHLYLVPDREVEHG